MPRRNAIAFVTAALLMGPAWAQQVRTPAPTHEQTLEAVNACGVPAANVRITYEDELQSDVVWISDLGGADEARFRCLRRAVHPAYIVDVSTAAQREPYDAFSSREDHKYFKAEAIEALKATGLLDRVPRYDPRNGVKAFAQAVETACSIRRGRAFETYGASGLTVRRQFFGKVMTTKIHDDLTCLLRMYAVSNAEEHDITLAFTGAEAPSDGRR